MRLIDADAMNEDLFYEQLGGKDTLITAESAFNMIKAQPTAYDIEKVVEELDKASFLMPPREKGHYADNGLFLEDAIDIVRKGGVK